MKVSWLRRVLIWIGICGAVFVLGFIVLPSPIVSRPTSNLVKCANNLHQIGLEISAYARDNGGNYPDSFESLLRYGLTHDGPLAMDFDCPATNDRPAYGPTTEATVTDFKFAGHCSYVYAGRGMKAGITPANAVVIYELLENHGGDVINVLVAGGDVEFLDKAAAIKILDQAAKGVSPILVL